MAQHDHELLSALKDGELDEQQAERVLSRLADDPELRQRWHRYHLVGDALRNNVPPVLNHDLAARVAAAVANEPTVLSPSSVRTRPVAKHKHDKTFTGYAVAASVAVVGFLTVGLVSNQLEQDVAHVGAPVAAVATSGLLAPAPTHATGGAVVAPVVASAGSASAFSPATPVTLQAEEPNLQSYMLHHELSAPALAGSPLAPHVRVVTFSADTPAP